MDQNTPLLRDKVAWDGNRLVVIEDGLVEQLRRKALSASTSKSMQSCAARWVGERLLRSEEEDPFAPAPLGTSAHSILEDLYDERVYTPEQRSMRLAEKLVLRDADEKWPDRPEEPDAVRAAVKILRRKWIADVKEAYEGIFVIEDPKTIRVYDREMQIDGLSLNGVPTNGFIDRIRYGTSKRGKDGLWVEDYKGLAVDTPIPTPTGWTTMGQLSKGDVVLGSDGKPTTVTAKSGTHHRLCYEVTFSDGTKVVCDNVHLWQIVDTFGRTPRGSETVDADELFRRVASRGRNISIHIPNTAPLELPEADLPIHPWVLGAWLGDGAAKTGELSVGAQDLHSMEELVAAHWGPALVRTERSTTQLTLTGVRKPGVSHRDWQAVGDTVYTKQPLRGDLRRAGLIGNKHIPLQYLRGSYVQRLQLLQGLMDTDGSFNARRGRAVFVTCNRTLAEGVSELISSLGVTVQWFEKDYQNATRPGATFFKLEFRPLDFVPFQLERKAAPVREMQASFARCTTTVDRSLRRDIVGMRVVDTVPTECIAVDAPDHLYLCGTTMVPTHNTGKMPSKYHLRYGDDHGDQIRIYAAALKEKTGELPVGGSVLYTKFGEKRDIDLSPAAMGKTLKTFELSWKRHNRYMKSGEFPTKVSALCGWCPLVNSCPVAKAEGKTVSEKVADQIHSATELGIRDRRPTAPVPHLPEAEDVMVKKHGQEVTFFMPDPFAFGIPDELFGDVESAAELAAHMYDSGAYPADRPEKDQTVKITEDKPWELYTVEGELNPASYASVRVFGIAELAVETLHRAGLEVKGGQVKSLAFTFLHVVSEAQESWTGTTSLAEASATRMLGALHTVLATMPVPFGQDSAAWEAWVAAAIRRCRSITAVALSLFGDERPAAPWEGLTAEGAAPAKPAEDQPAAGAEAVEAAAEDPAPEAPAAEEAEAPAPARRVVKRAPKKAAAAAEDFDFVPDDLAGIDDPVFA